ncbi:MAG: aminotransferase class IV [Chlorobi bacterium]|nr:aminotransferase class IV [Chlorobiota bacterium]
MTGQYYIHNGNPKTKSNFKNPFRPGKLNIYEVVRIDDGIPLFLEDHLERLNKSFALAGIPLHEKSDSIITNLFRLINLNKISVGLIRIVFCFENQTYSSMIFQSRVRFPAPDVYKEGVTCTIQQAERDNPEAKVYNHTVRDIANRIIAEKHVFETLLANHNGIITEGSRSNVFFVENNILITAPANMVLQGITRAKVVELARKSGIEVVCSPFDVKNLPNANAVFLTGTTPKVMPVKQIDNYSFDVQNELTRILMEKYDNLIEEYKKSARNKFQYYLP